MRDLFKKHLFGACPIAAISSRVDNHDGVGIGLQTGCTNKVVQATLEVPILFGIVFHESRRLLSNEPAGDNHHDANIDRDIETANFATCSLAQIAHGKSAPR